MRIKDVLVKFLITLFICIGLFITYKYSYKLFSEHNKQSYDLIKEEFVNYNDFFKEFQSREIILEEDYEMFISELNRLMLIDFSNDINDNVLQGQMIKLALKILFTVLILLFVLEWFISLIKFFIKRNKLKREEEILRSNYNYYKAVEFFDNFKNKS